MKDIGARKNIYGNDWAQKAGREIFPILIQMAIDDQKPYVLPPENWTTL